MDDFEHLDRPPESSRSSYPECSGRDRRDRRLRPANRNAAARLILEEIKVVQRAVSTDDARLGAAAMDPPTSEWKQRREYLLSEDEWPAIAEAFSEIDELNVRRTAQAIWRIERTANELRDAYEAIGPRLDAAEAALRKLAGA